MIIKQKTISKKTSSFGGAETPTTLQVGNNSYTETENKIEIPQTVNSVSVNGATFQPDNGGNVDLGTIGGTANDGELTLTLNGGSVGTFTANQAQNETVNINAVTSVTQNSQTSTVGSGGNIDLGNVVKTVIFQGSTITPNTAGQAQLPTVQTTKYGSLLGGLISSNNSSVNYSSYTEPVGFLYALTSTASNRFQNWGYLIDFPDCFIYCLISTQELTKTADYTYSAKLAVQIYSDTNSYEIYPVIRQSTTRLSNDSTATGVVIKGLNYNKRPQYGFSETTTTQSSYTVYLNVTDGEDTTGNNYPFGLIQLNGIETEIGVNTYQIEYSVTNKNINSYTVTKLDNKGNTINLNNTIYSPNSSGEINIGNLCKKINLNGVPFNVDNTGTISLEAGASLWVTETPFGLVPCFSTSNTNSDFNNRVTAVSFLARPNIYSPTSLYIWRTVVTNNYTDITPYAIKIELQTTHYEYNDSTKSATFTGNVIVTNKGVTTGNSNILSFLVVPYFFEFSELSNKMQIALLHYDDITAEDSIFFACSNVDTWYPVNVSEENGFVEVGSFSTSTTDPLNSTYSGYLQNKTNVITADSYITKWSVAITITNNTVSSISVAKVGSLSL